MKRLILLLGGMVFAISAGVAQQHAPTSEVCRADVNLWSEQKDNDKFSYDELMSRKEEMTSCFSSDPDKGLVVDSHNYLSLANRYSIALSLREEHFIQRHGLSEQFFQEDAAGAR